MPAMCNRRRKEPSQLCTKCCCAIDPTITLCAEVCQAGTQASQFNRLLCRTTPPPRPRLTPSRTRRTQEMRLVMKMKRVMKLEEFAGNGVPLNFPSQTSCCLFTLLPFLQDVKVFSDPPPQSQAPTYAFVTSNN